MNKHTPTPWTYNKLDKWNYITRNNSTSLKNIIATIEQNGDDEESNAKFIVKAVNNHEGLVNNLKLANKIIYEVINKRITNQELSIAWHDLQQVIDKIGATDE